MSWIWRIVLFLLGQEIKGRIVTRAKSRGLIMYLRALQGTRRGIIFALLGFFVLQTLVLAGFGALLTGVWLLDLDSELKLKILCGVCCALFFVPVLLLAYALSERVWYRASGAQKMMNDLHHDRDGESKNAA